MKKKWFDISVIAENGPAIIEHDKFNDERGHFHRLFCENELGHLNFRGIRQINHSFTKRAGTVRGLHFQVKPYSEAKVIFCLSGKINDYILDLRADSPNLGRVYKVKLFNSKGVFIPQGFAHGFQTLEENTNLIYFHDQFYNSEHESGLSILSTKLKIVFDMEIAEMSQRDSNFSEYGEHGETYL